MTSLVETSKPDASQGIRFESTGKSKPDAPWRTADLAANKSGQRGTIYWVGKSIIGEDGSDTGQRTKGASYHGEWQDNKKSGYGVQGFPNGEKYEGQWARGLRNGEGTLWVPTGKAKKLRKLYVGGWKDDKRHGRGTCFFKNGEFFQGSWDHGKMHGNGSLRYGNGDLHVGEWRDGLRSGQGMLNKANGDCYEGSWLNDKREGSGSYFYASSGKVFVGEWANDLPKAGVYTQAKPNPQQATVVPTTSILPPVRLAQLNEVLESSLTAVRLARRGFRAQNTPVKELFADDELQALQSAFQLEQVNGCVGLNALQGLCSNLGTEIALSRLQALLSEIGIVSKDANEAMSIGFEDFLRVVALLLDEEAAQGPEFSQMAEQDDDWGTAWGAEQVQEGAPSFEDDLTDLSNFYGL